MCSSFLYVCAANIQLLAAYSPWLQYVTSTIRDARPKHSTAVSRVALVDRARQRQCGATRVYTRSLRGGASSARASALRAGCTPLASSPRAGAARPAPTRSAARCERQPGTHLCCPPLHARTARRERCRPEAIQPHTARFAPRVARRRPSLTERVYRLRRRVRRAHQAGASPAATSTSTTTGRGLG